MKFTTTLLIILFCGPAWTFGGPKAVRGKDAEQQLQVLMNRTRQYLAQAEAGIAVKSDDLSILAELLEEEVKATLRSRVVLHDGPSLSLEAKDNLLFETVPELPPEDKEDDRWSFEPIRFEVVPQGLYIYALTFKAARTIRIKSVTLYFRDGSSIVHDQWSGQENGNGRAFRKREYLPWFTAYKPDSPRQAKALAAVEVLGSAQDAHFSSSLSFFFEVPDPEAPLPSEPLALCSEIKRKMRDTRPNLRQLQEWYGLLDRLAKDPQFPR